MAIIGNIPYFQTNPYGDKQSNVGYPQPFRHTESRDLQPMDLPGSEFSGLLQALHPGAPIHLLSLPWQEGKFGIVAWRGPSEILVHAISLKT